jgi:hypothetical protein
MYTGLAKMQKEVVMACVEIKLWHLVREMGQIMENMRIVGVSPQI